MEIITTSGKTILLDTEDWHNLHEYSWWTIRGKTTEYAVRNRGKKHRKMHRDIMGDPPEGFMIDHVNGNGLDNRRSNLRFVTNRQNSQNRHTKKTSTYPGVSWDKDHKRWRAGIQIGENRIRIGRYRSEIEAFAAYCKALGDIGEVLLP